MNTETSNALMSQYDAIGRAENALKDLALDLLREDGDPTGVIGYHLGTVCAALDTARNALVDAMNEREPAKA